MTPIVEFRVKDFSPNETAHKFVMEIIRPALLQMQLTDDDLQKIVVADNEHYGPAIKEFSPEEGFTDDGIYQGVGKILPRITNGIYQGSDLVIHACVISSFVSSGNDEPIDERDAMRYAVYHELGHCADYRRRQLQKETRCQEIASMVLRCAERNSATLLSEYAACFFSAPFLTAAGFAYSANSTGENLGQYLDALAENRDKYLSRAIDLAAVRNGAIETFWRAMIEYGKLFAYMHGNPALAQMGKDLVVWHGSNRLGGKVIESMSMALRDAWNSYPECAGVFEKSLTIIWFSLCESEGYRFEVKPEGDYLWLS